MLKINSDHRIWEGHTVSRELSLLLLDHLDDINFTHRFPYSEKPGALVSTWVSIVGSFLFCFLFILMYINFTHHFACSDSEMDVVQNKVTLIPITQSSKDLRDGFNVNDVGYNPEIYVGDEKEKGGLRVVRDGEGKPVKPVFEISG